MLPAVFAEFHRTLAPGGHLLWGDHVGDGGLRPTQATGRPVSYESYLVPPDRWSHLLDQAGLVVTASLWKEPGEGSKRAAGTFFARKPERP